MAKGWTFRGDDELDPLLAKWSKQGEKSFHVRQALRLYIRGSNPFLQNVDLSDQVDVEVGEVGVSLNEWG